MNDLKIQGNPDEQDSFVACICGVLSSWGRKVEYTRVAGLAGIVFSPVYNDREDCRAWWMEGGNDIRIGFLGKALGFSVEEFEREWVGRDKVWNGNPTSEKIPLKTSEHFDKLKDAVHSGKSVLIDTWPTWSVLTGWNDDVTRLPFETFPSFLNLVSRAWPPHKTGKAYALFPTDPSLVVEEADRDALAFGVKVATGSFHSENLHYGGLFYRAVAKRLIHEPFCVPCGNESYRCAVRTVKRAVESAKSATVYLNSVGAEKVVSRYQAICDVLEKYQDGGFLKDFWSDRKFRFEMKDAFLTAYRIQREAAKELGRV
jgi:hypothetical protein